MKTFKLSKTFTTVKYGLYFLTVLTGIQAHSQTTVTGTGTEVAGSGSRTYPPQQGQVVISDEQFRAQQCASDRNKVAENLEDFNKACSEAGLGGTSACRETLLECREAEDAEDNPSCLNHALTSDDVKVIKERADDTRDRADELRKRIEDKYADLQELEGEAMSLVRRKDQADAKLEEALAGIQGEEAKAFRDAVAQMDSISMEVEKYQNELKVLELELEAFVLENESNCRKEANEYKQRRYNGIVNSSRGNRPNVSQHSLFQATGLSAKDIAGLEADRRLRQCMSPRVHTRFGARVTAFGSQYAFKEKQIKIKRQNIQQTIRRLTAQRRTVIQSRNDLLRTLAHQEQRTISAHAKQKFRLDQEGRLIRNKEAKILSELRDLRMEHKMADLQKMDADYRMQRMYASEIKSSDDDKRKAFIQADAALRNSKEAARSVQEAMADCRDSAWIAGVLERLTGDESSRDIASDDGIAEILLPDEENPDAPDSASGGDDDADGGSGGSGQGGASARVGATVY